MARWTNKDKQRVRAALDKIVGSLDGGQAELARKLGLASRAVVNNWWRRGTVPIEHHKQIISLAPSLTPDMLHPTARLLSELQLP